MNMKPEAVIADVVRMAAEQNPKAAQTVLYSCHEIPTSYAGAADMGKGFFYSLTIRPMRLDGMAEPVYADGVEFSEVFEEAIDELVVMLEAHYAVKLRRPAALPAQAPDRIKNTCFHSRDM